MQLRAETLLARRIGQEPFPKTPEGFPGWLKQILSDQPLCLELGPLLLEDGRSLSHAPCSMQQWRIDQASLCGWG